MYSLVQSITVNENTQIICARNFIMFFSQDKKWERLQNQQKYILQQKKCCGWGKPAICPAKQSVSINMLPYATVLCLLNQGQIHFYKEENSRILVARNRFFAFSIKINLSNKLNKFFSPSIVWQIYYGGSCIKRSKSPIRRRGTTQLCSC